MPNMWSNDRIFYAAGRDTLKETEKSPASAPPEPSGIAGTAETAGPPRTRQTLKRLIGRLFDPHLLPEDDEDLKSPVSRR
jgi:hypothetical protein